MKVSALTNQTSITKKHCLFNVILDYQSDILKTLTLHLMTSSNLLKDLH